MKREFEFLLSKTLSMFRYEGLPDSMPQRDLERQLQTKGYAFVTEFKGELYSFTDGLGGEPDAYGNPTQIVIANPALGFNKTLNLKEDGVLIRNDSMMNGLRHLIQKHVFMMTENDVTMVMNSYNSRVPTLISAGDDSTKESAEAYLRKIVDGDLGVIAENRLFEGINSQATGGVGSLFTQLIEYQQYLKASLFNELGLEMNNNMKRERLTQDEVNMVDAIYPFVDNMMMNRDKAIKEINKKYNKNIEIEFDSIWAKHNEQTDEEFLAEVDMYLDQMMGGAEEPGFGGASEEDLQSILNELTLLAEEEDNDTNAIGDRDSSGSDSDADRREPESRESGSDTEPSGGDRSDDSKSDDDNTGRSDESSTGDSESDTTNTSAEDTGEVSRDAESTKGSTSGSTDSGEAIHGERDADDTPSSTGDESGDDVEGRERTGSQLSGDGPDGSTTEQSTDTVLDTPSVEVNVDVSVEIEEEEEDESK